MTTSPTHPITSPRMCGSCVYILLALVATLAHSQPAAAAGLVVSVDPILGNDIACLSAQELLLNQTSLPPSQTPCQTVNKALGNVRCDVGCRPSGGETIENVTIRLEDGIHTLTECVGVLGSSNVTFEATNPGMATIECTNFQNSSDFDNLFVCNTIGVMFRGIQFEHCGPISANVFLNDTSDIVFEDCTFRGNSGSAIQLQFCTGVKLIDTLFIENINQRKATPDENETSIEELYDSITTAGGFTFFSRDEEQVEILIQNCSFISNAANKNDPNNSRPVLLKANGHGGGILIRLSGVMESVITISDCLFENNTAQVDGGAIYFSLSDGLTSNTINLINNTFINNIVTVASGGAVSINSFNFSFNNTVWVDSCNFYSNQGNAGGAFSVALYDSNLLSTQSPDSVVFRNCEFKDNAAFNEGTAVGLFSLVHVDQVGFPINFTDCIFENNTSLEDTQDTSAIAAFRFPTNFSGFNHFIGNKGGGITLLNTRMQASGTVLFRSNTAVFGGGIAMDDRCLLEVSPGTDMMFDSNIVKESGGGIYVEFPPIRFVVDIFNRLCFLQYNDGMGTDVAPQDWEDVKISFINNTARLSGAAIFASDMQQCAWLGNFTSDTSLIFLPPPEIADQSPFVYENNSLLPEGQNVSRLNSTELATAPSRIHLIVEYSLVQPGEMLPINLLATDQVNNSREAVWSLEAPSQPANLDALSANNDTYVYEVPSAKELPGLGGEMDFDSNNFESQFTLNFSLLRTLGFISSLDLNVSGCHPGFRLRDQGGNTVCECDTSETDILRCDDNNRYLYLREGIWGGVETSSDGTRTLITARVQPGFVTCTPQGRLPGCLFMFDRADDQCRSGRRGRLCGTCVADHGVTLDLQDCTADSCVAGLVLFILLCVSVVVVALLIIFFNVELPNELKGFFFYAQVIGLVYRPYIVVQSDNSGTDPLRILVNLLGFSVPIPLCLHTTLKAHHVALLGYISPTLVLLMVLLYVLGARYCKPLSNRSALKGITFLSLIVYKYIADSSFIFISCISTDFGFVFQYDGSLDCNSWEFGIFALIGLFLMVFLVAPAPFAVGYICIKRPQKFQQYADVLTKGLVSKHRWWGGWDIGRRLPFVVIGYFIVLARPSLVLFFMSLAALVALILHLFVKPYENKYINIIEAAILLNLLMVTAAFLDPSNSPVPEWFSTMLLILPYVYAVGYFGYLIAKYLWKRFGPHVMTMMMNEKPEDQPGGAGTEGDTERTSGSEKPTSQSTGQSSGGTQTMVTAGGRIMDEEEAFTALREPLLEL